MKRTRRYASGALLCLALLLSVQNSFADDVVVGRYLSVTAKPSSYQRHLLQQHIELYYPKNVLTIHQAIQFLLQFSGYRLMSMDGMDKAARTTLNQSLPEVDRHMGPLALAQALTTLVGPFFYVLVDPVHRLIGFQLKPHYEHLYEKPDLITRHTQTQELSHGTLSYV